MMSTTQTIETDEAPGAVGPYSQGRRTGDMIFTSGQIALDPSTGEMVQSDLTSEARRVLDNLQAVVEAGGARMKDVVKTTVYVTDLDHYDQINEVYRTYFSESLPARTFVEVSRLPKQARLEIEAVARAGS